MKNTVFISHDNGNHTLLLVSTIILFFITAFASFTRWSNYILYPFWSIFLIYVFSHASTVKLTRDENIFVKISIIFLLIVLLYGILGLSSMPRLSYLVKINWLLSGVVSIYAMKFLSSREQYLLYIVMFIVLVLLMIVFIRIGRTLFLYDEFAAADTTNAWYGSLFVFISGLSLIFIINVNKLSLRIVAMLVLLLTLYLNFVILQRGTNVILTILELGLILFFLIKRKSFIIISLIIIAFSFFVLSFDNLIAIIDWLAQVIPSERLAKRFNDISIVLTYGNIDATNGSMAARSELMKVSWNTFTSSFGHFLFGVGEHASDNDVIGHHSFIIDELACYGIVGGVVLFVYFKKQYQIIMSHLNKRTEWALYMQCAVLFLFYIIRNFYGNVAFSLVNFVMLLFFPLTFQLISYYSNNN